MTFDDTVNFLEALGQRLQHGGLLADQANDIGVRLQPHLDLLKQVKQQNSTIIDVTPTPSTQVVPTGFQAPAPPSQWTGG